MLAYIGPIIVLITGVLGIFFSKGGERQKLSLMTYVFLGLVVVSGMVSIYGVRAAAADAANKAKAAAVREAQLARDAAVRAEQLRREKRQSDTLRGLLLARTFAPRDVPMSGILVLDLPVSAAALRGENDGEHPFQPLLGKGVRSSTFKFEVEDMVDLDYRIAPAGAGGVTIDSNWYEYGDRTCRLTSENGYDFAAASGSPCRHRDRYRVNAALHVNPSERQFQVSLPEQNFWKFYSRIEQVQRGGNTLGQLTIEADSPREVPALLAQAAQIAPSIIFVRSYGRPDEDACGTSLIVHLASQARRTGPQTIVVEIGGMEDFDLNFCEINLDD